MTSHEQREPNARESLVSDADISAAEDLSEEAEVLPDANGVASADAPPPPNDDDTIAEAEVLPSDEDDTIAEAEVLPSDDDATIQEAEVLSGGSDDAIGQAEVEAIAEAEPLPGPDVEGMGAASELTAAEDLSDQAEPVPDSVQNPVAPDSAMSPSAPQNFAVSEALDFATAPRRSPTPPLSSRPPPPSARAIGIPPLPEPPPDVSQGLSESAPRALYPVPQPEAKAPTIENKDAKSPTTSSVPPAIRAMRIIAVGEASMPSRVGGLSRPPADEASRPPAVAEASRPPVIEEPEELADEDIAAVEEVQEDLTDQEAGVDDAGPFAEAAPAGIEEGVEPPQELADEDFAGVDEAGASDESSGEVGALTSAEPAQAAAFVQVPAETPAVGAEEEELDDEDITRDDAQEFSEAVSVALRGRDAMASLAGELAPGFVPTVPARPARPAPPPPPLQARAEKKALEATVVPPAAKRRPWWEEMFAEEDLMRAHLPLTRAQLNREVDFIERSLGIAAGGSVLDLGCGSGQHAVELASRGYGVIAFDMSLHQLAAAIDSAQERGQKLSFLQGDMRELEFESTFDGIFCWNTTFGYFEEDKNLSVAQRVFQALRPGGSFLLDVANRDYVSARTPCQNWYEGDTCLCMDDARMDFLSSRLRVRRSIIMDDGRTLECVYSVRVYALHELGKLLHHVGFLVTEASGHTATPGVFFGDVSPRIIMLAQRPED